MAAGVEACRAAAKGGADLALFPEMWSIGYRLPQTSGEEVERFLAKAVPENGTFTQCFANLAAETGMAIGITYLERAGEAVRNSLALYDRHGRKVLTYSKVHTCEWGVEGLFERGQRFTVAQLDTREGAVNVGAMICFDREFPESARVLMLQGAELILVPNACQMDIHRMSQLKGRAYENMTAVALTNYPRPFENGHSVLLSGMAYAADESILDMVLTECGEDETVALADLDLKALRQYREREVWGNAFRRPDLYSDLVSRDVKPPFMRQRSR
jgi:predicted amidohydrolase